MSRADNYEGFINDLGREVLNRNEIREQQKKEVARLETTLKNLRLHQNFLQDQTKVLSLPFLPPLFTDNNSHFFFFFFFFFFFSSFHYRNTTPIWTMCCNRCM